MKESDRRNLNAHQEARVAAALWGKEYSEQNGGLMDFWDGLPASRKRISRDVAADIRKATPEAPTTGGHDG